MRKSIIDLPSFISHTYSMGIKFGKLYSQYVDVHGLAENKRVDAHLDKEIEWIAARL